MTEDVSVMFQKGLSEWWSEETEYIFQRIERWAAYARGYNRLRSQRLSRGRMTMQREQEESPRWTISSNKLIIDDASWSPRFHTLKKPRRKSPRTEETRINCCGTFNYQSNSSLDSSCLETYRYDHSIYFKTIGDIRNGKKDDACDGKDREEDRVSISSEELVEWDVNAVSDFIANQLLDERLASDDVENDADSDDEPTLDANAAPVPVAWLDQDLSSIDLNEDDVSANQEQTNRNNLTIERNNNCTLLMEPLTKMNLENRNTEPGRVIASQDCTQTKGVHVDGNGIGRFLDARRNSRRSGAINHRPIAGDNYVIWPSVLLNYTKNIDPSISPHRIYHGSKK